MKKMPVILIDTREQTPLPFVTSRGVRIKRVTLKVGDYSLQGHSTRGVVIERKSLADFFSSFAGRHRPAMMRKLERMGAFHSAMLLVEADVDEVLNGSRFLEVSGPSLFGSVVGACVDAGVQALFVHDRDAAAVAAHRFLANYLERLRAR